jgi:hypothetical protein
MILQKRAYAVTNVTNTETDKESLDNKEEKTLLDLLNKKRAIELKPSTQHTLGLGALAGLILNASDKPLLGAIRGLGTAGGALGGYRGGDALTDLLVNGGKLDDMSDVSRASIRLGLRGGGALLGGILAHKFIKDTTE